MKDEVIGEESTWSTSSVGRLQVTMKKKDAPKYWKNLFREGTDIPNNVKVWFEMKEKFNEELQKYIDEHEEELEREEEEKTKAQRKKKRANNRKEKSNNEKKENNTDL
jgi:hypothetical protein